MRPTNETSLTIEKDENNVWISAVRVVHIVVWLLEALGTERGTPKKILTGRETLHTTTGTSTCFVKSTWKPKSKASDERPYELFQPPIMFLVLVNGKSTIVIKSGVWVCVYPFFTCLLREGKHTPSLLLALTYPPFCHRYTRVCAVLLRYGVPPAGSTRWPAGEVSRSCLSWDAENSTLHAQQTSDPNRLFSISHIHSAWLLHIAWWDQVVYAALYVLEVRQHFDPEVTYSVYRWTGSTRTLYVRVAEVPEVVAVDTHVCR